MLPEDSKARRAQVLEESQQTNDNDHFKPAPKEEKPEPFSDELFKQTAIEWLIETNQVRTRNITDNNIGLIYFFIYNVADSSIWSPGFPENGQHCCSCDPRPQAAISEADKKWNQAAV